VTNIWKAQRM